MDTVGAIAGPATALALLPLVRQNYRVVFGLTLIPGLMAALLIAFVVKEKERAPVPHISLGASVRAMPPRYRRFLAAAGLFGAGDFAHTLLLLLAAQKLAPTLGLARATTAATAFYILHNIVSAGASLVAGRLADRVNKGRLLAAAYGLAVLMALGLVFLPMNVWTLAGVFSLGRPLHRDGGNAGRFVLRGTRRGGEPRCRLRAAGHGERRGRFRLQPDRRVALVNGRRPNRFRLQRRPFPRRCGDGAAFGAKRLKNNSAPFAGRARSW